MKIKQSRHFHPRKKISAIVTATPTGGITVTVKRPGAKKPEALAFDSLLDLLSWPGLDGGTAIRFSSKGLVPDLTLPCELIFCFCPPDEIRTFMDLSRAGDKVEWARRYADLVKSLQREQFPFSEIIGNSVDLTELVENPNGYPMPFILRRYRDEMFW